MPRRKPEMSWTKIRMLTEKLRWMNRYGEWETGYNVPKSALEWEHVPFQLKAVTLKGSKMDGEVTCISVDTQFHRRKVKFVNSGEIRWVYDILIKEVDGVVFIAH